VVVAVWLGGDCGVVLEKELWCRMELGVSGDGTVVVIAMIEL
jgi:hypothetical protein